MKYLFLLLLTFLLLAPAFSVYSDEEQVRVPEQCSYCGGKGYILTGQPAGCGLPVSYPCPNCGGTGIIWTYEWQEKPNPMFYKPDNGDNSSTSRGRDIRQEQQERAIEEQEKEKEEFDERADQAAEFVSRHAPTRDYVFEGIHNLPPDEHRKVIEQMSERERLKYLEWSAKSKLK